MPRRGGLGYLAVILFAFAMLFANVLRHPVYTPDGIVYARYAARDAGAGDRDATLQARAYYEQSPLAASPRYRPLIELDPSVAFARSQIFVNRVLYPRIVALLLPATGFRALFIVSAAAYVLFGIALFWLLDAFRSFWTALGITIVALALPITRDLAASDLTDMLAALFWTLALGALLRSLALERSALLTTVLAAASVLLVLTRPTPYLIVLPALAAGITRGLWVEFGAACTSIVAFALDAVTTHAFGFMQQLQWIYDRVPGTNKPPLGVWYRGALLQTDRAAAASGVKTVIPPVALLCAIYAARGRFGAEAWVLAAAFVACLLSLIVNPVPDQIARVVGFPLIPVFTAMIQAAAAQFAADRRSSLRGVPVR
ncbi:MAG TPA: hypothetical protein VFL13_10175 [Candidatus Baltobacteraceae bacterium]|nr:hypothetical protein [Candidatus Baltobacteraceae bacterium]